MDITSKQQDYLEPLSHQLGLLKGSPYLSPMRGLQMMRNSQRFSDCELLNFDLGQPEYKYDGFNEGDEIFFGSQQKTITQEIISENQKDQDDQLVFEDQETQNPPLLELIKILINSISTPDQQLTQKAKQVTKNSTKLMEVYKILHKKFKKLKKTKEQMTKYCMRKAFKSISQRNKFQTYKLKFQNHKFQSPKTSYSSPTNSLFKKICSQKTMNGNFLKKIFSQQNFTENYFIFLCMTMMIIENFKELIQEDNEKKVKYLANVIKHYLLTNNFRKIQLIKRLPWTRQILNRTQQLGRQLPKYADPNNVFLPRRSKL